MDVYDATLDALPEALLEAVAWHLDVRGVHRLPAIGAGIRLRRAALTRWRLPTDVVRAEAGSDTERDACRRMLVQWWAAAAAADEVDVDTSTDPGAQYGATAVAAPTLSALAPLLGRVGTGERHGVLDQSAWIEVEVAAEATAEAEADDTKTRRWPATLCVERPCAIQLHPAVWGDGSVRMRIGAHAYARGWTYPVAVAGTRLAGMLARLVPAATRDGAERELKRANPSATAGSGGWEMELRLRTGASRSPGDRAATTAALARIVAVLVAVGGSGAVRVRKLWPVDSWRPWLEGVRAAVGPHRAVQFAEAYRLAGCSPELRLELQHSMRRAGVEWVPEGLEPTDDGAPRV